MNRHTYKLYSIFSLIVIYSFLFHFMGCTGSESNERFVRSEKNKLLDEKYSKIKNGLLNKRISSLNEIIDSTRICQNKRTLLYYYNGMDCITCIENGYKIINNLEHILPDSLIITITTNSNIWKDQSKYKYLKYIWDDREELVRKELNLFPTPVFFIIDQELQIIDVFFLDSYNFKLEIINDIKTYLFS